LPTPTRRLEAWIDPHIEVRPSPIQGRGMFTTAPIRAGEVVIVWGGELFTGEDVQAGKARQDSVAAIGEDLYLADPVDAPDCPDYFLNHSCDPNVWMQDAVTLIARRDIAPGEELTADYALWEVDEDWTLPEKCRCGSPLCRTIITGGDWQLTTLQQRYAGHFSPLLNQRIEQSNAGIHTA
jgi:SET domain-containing protein